MAEIRLPAAWVAEVARGEIVAGNRGTVFTGVSIDSRTIGPGELYVAIRGERFDGVEFAAPALARGGAGAIVPRGRGPGVAAKAQPSDAPVIEVDDPVEALQAIAHAVRAESGAKVVAITGSAGKTTTKEVTAEFLEAKYRVIRNRGNFNNHIGLPLSLVKLAERPEVAVVELGMNHAGEISTLVRIAQPDVRVWTNVGEAHVGFFGSLDAIADAKAEILERATASNRLVANADDERITARIARFAGRVISFGIDRPADVQAETIIDRGIEGTTARVATPRGAIELTTPLVGRGNLANVLAATAVAIDFDVPLDAIAERASRLRPAAHRGDVLRLARGVTVVDDSYNANPTAMRRALEVIARTRAARRVAFLGEMLELGDLEVPLHQDVGRAAAAAGLDLLVTIGGASARALGDAAIAAGLERDAVRHFDTSEEAADAATALVRPGDVVLVKSSHGVRTDIVVDRVKAELA